MEERERAWPLITLTVLGPASAGCLLAQLVLVAGRTSTHPALAILTLGLVLAAAAILASLAHLSQPLRAYRALRRFPKSPLSREVGAYTIYLVLAFAAWLTELIASSPWWLTGVAALAGWVAVATSALLYLLPARPTWRHWSTVATFLGCGLSLGFAAALALSLAGDDALLDPSRLDLARALSLGGVALAAAALGGRLTYLRSATEDTKAAWAATAGALGFLLGLRIATGLVLAAQALALSFFTPVWLFVAVGALLAGELLDRLLFFRTVVPLSFRAEIPVAR